MRDIRFRAWDKVNNKMLSHKDMLDGSWDNWPTLFFAITDNDIYIPMQFTGLHDRNGKEIYEGDITEIDRLYKGQKTIFVCKWNKSNACFENCWGNVIGNIYENPNLIQEG